MDQGRQPQSVYNRRFDRFFELYDTKPDREFSKTIDRATIEANKFDIKAVNTKQNRKSTLGDQLKYWHKFYVYIMKLRLISKNCSKVQNWIRYINDIHRK